MPLALPKAFQSAGSTPAVPSALLTSRHASRASAQAEEKDAALAQTRLATGLGAGAAALFVLAVGSVAFAPRGLLGGAVHVWAKPSTNR